MPTELTLLGQPKVSLAGQLSTPSPTRPFLLCAYLAYQAEWVSRDSLLTLFWPEVGEKRARQSLRALLYQGKKEAYSEGLEVTGTGLRYLVATDVQRFQDAMSTGDWQSAVALYGGAFLAPVGGDTSGTFEDWLYATRDELHVAWRDAALHVADELTEKGRYGEASDLLQNVLGYDFLAEDVVQACMRVQALAGQKAGALGTFETFRKQLHQDLELEPLEATLDLAEAIHKGDVQAPVTHTPKRQTPAYASALPQPLTPFIGRTLELIQIANLLAQPENRLITLLGPGGMGKSRLALRVLEDYGQDFPDGAVFVSLAPLGAAREIPDAVAAALGLALAGGVPVEAEIITYLRDTTTLLVLDNCEHLLGGMDVATRILSAAPHCHILCTSRALLGLANEVVFDVVGLNSPSAADSSVEAYDAAQLFVRSARRARSDFSLQQADYPALVDLCRYLEGMPLALELAATWVRLFSLPELLHELKRDSDLLEAAEQQVSERHRSIRRVFLHSWDYLSAEEQRVLAGLSVFHGGFDVAAARSVVGASARTLLSLVNKSLLRTTAAGRFSILEVIRQYAAEKVSGAGLEQAHADYYLAYLSDQGGQFRGSQPKTHLLAVESNLDNIRFAWRWALAHRQVEALETVAPHLSFFFDLRARVQEGLALFQEAVDALKGLTTLGVFLIHQAVLYRWTGNVEQVGMLSLTGLKLLKADDLANRIPALNNLAYVSDHKGDMNALKRYSLEAFEVAKLSGDRGRIVHSTMGLALAEHALFHYEEADRLYGEALAGYRALGDLIGCAEVLSNWGEMILEGGEPREAQVMLLEALDLARTNGDDGFLYICLANMGSCAYSLGDFERAKSYYQEALPLVHDKGNQGNEAQYLADYARVALALQNPAEAYEVLRQSVNLAWATGSLTELTNSFCSWGEYLLRVRELDLAQKLLSEVVNHPATFDPVRQRAKALLGDEEPVDRAPAEGDESLEAYVETLLSLDPPARDS